MEELQISLTPARVEQKNFGLWLRTPQVGQVLNAGIYRAIGHKGVYYGFKLGHTIPWVDGFPFTVVRHPQYVGSVATVVGGACLCSGMIASGELWALTVYWMLLYVFTGIMES